MDAEKKGRYARAAHAVQSGLATLIGIGDQRASPKHLRVGVDLTKAEMGGLSRLLITKGVFTEEEYLDAMVDGVEREADSLQKEVSDRLGRPVTLG